MQNSLSYNLGKVLWKMWDYCDRMPGYSEGFHYKLPIDAIIQAIKACPDKRDSRHPEKDPILEPHYKLVSVVHKLVRRGSISVCYVLLSSKLLLTYSSSQMRVSISCKLHHTPVKLPRSMTLQDGTCMYCMS